MNEQSRRSTNDVDEVISLDDPRMDRRESDAIPWTRADLRLLIELNQAVQYLRQQQQQQDLRVTTAIVELTARVVSLETTRSQQQGAQQGAAVLGKIATAGSSALWGLIGAAVAIYTGSAALFL